MEADVWEAFWQSGATACCGGPEEGHYIDDLTERWQEFFEDMSEACRVLDLCSGNGALLLLAAKAADSQGVDVELCGVDAANVDPARDNPVLAAMPCQIDFRNSTSITDMPYATDAFDLVTSQFGIEYTPIEPAATEIVRVMKSGARAQFILHADEGVTTRNALDELADIDELVEQIAVFDAASEAIRRVCRVEQAGSAASEAEVAGAMSAYQSFQSRLRAIGDSWRERAAKSVYRSCGEILQHTFLHRRQFPVEALLDKVEETRRAVEAHRGRLRQLVGAARSSEGCDSIASVFSDLGCRKAGTRPLHDSSGEHLLGWQIGIRN